MEKQSLKIVSFERPADFYFQSALKMIDNTNYLGALPMVRKALEKAPGNLDYMMKYAEILTELSKYEESNSILFEIQMKAKNERSECFFGMGCNFIGLGDLDKAEESFEKYLAASPNGEYREDVEEFLALFCDIEEEEEYLLEDAYELKQQKLAEEGKRYLDNCEYQKAVEVLEKIDTNDPGMLFAKNNLALSYYCMKKTEEAIRITQKVLEREPENIHANCNMAMFLSRKDHVAACKYVEKTERRQKNTQDDFYKIAITYCEIGEHEKALKYLSSILATCPYDEKVLFCAAVASFNMRHYAESVNFFSDIIKLEPEESIASYYLKYVKDVMEGKKKHDELSYVFQVPPNEARKRIRYLNEKMKLPEEEFKQLWVNDRKLKDILLWGLEYGDNFIKQTVVEIISGFGGEKAERVFRRYILKRNQPDEIKNEIFIALKRMHADEPYIAYFNGGIVEVKVGILENVEENETKYFDKLFDLIVSVVSEEYSEQLAGKAVSLLQEFTERGAGSIYFPETKELAAAIAFVTLYLNGKTAEIRKIAALFDADVNRLSAIAMEIINTVGKKEEE